MRKLFRLVQLEEIAERIMQEGLVPDARDERDPVHLDALVLQVGDRGIDVVDSDFEHAFVLTASSQHPGSRSGRGSCVMPSTSQ